MAGGEPPSDLDERARRLVPPVESLLFVADKPVELRRLARVLRSDLRTVRRAVELLGEDCQGRGVAIVQQKDAAQMVSHPASAAYVEEFLGVEGSGRLSQAALETLAIIAYHQPTTRAQIEAIRGVNSDSAVATLLARGLVHEAGRAETAGRPALLETTFEFLSYFGLSDLDQLPPLEDGSVPEAAAALGGQLEDTRGKEPGETEGDEARASSGRR